MKHLMLAMVGVALNAFAATPKTVNQEPVTGNEKPGTRNQELRTRNQICTNVIMTSWGRSVTAENAWREYPRPQLVRDSWECLNGEWEYAVTSVATDEPKTWDGKILVPFPIESELSGVRRKVSPGEQIWYRRSFTVRPQKGMRTILNFERVDFRASVFVNGAEVTDVPHAGGNVPFSCDVTEFVRNGENELKVLVWDPTDTHLGGTGKQVLELWTCFFGASSGICGSVWTETVPETYLADYHVTTDAGNSEVRIMPEVKGKLRTADVSVTVSFAGKKVGAASGPADEPLSVKLPKPVKLWSCDEPNLYDFEITVGNNGVTDRAKGYFGVRTAGTKLDARGIRRVVINDRFTYFLATLDQGWWPDGLLTPPSEDACRFDVDFHKKAGFNAIRKHIKIEPRAFYAHCDRIGVMVLQDIPSFGADRVQGDLEYANKRYGFYRKELKDCVDHLRNHPSVVMWIPFNEGWGQPSADKTRHTNKWLRRYDPTRLINGPSGWNDYEGGRTMPYANWSYADVADGDVYTDCVDLHHYPDARMHPAGAKRVSILGEFGGMGVALAGHVMNPKGKAYNLISENEPTWRKAQEKRYAALMKPLPGLARKGLGGSVYTEAIDQFWELGGFVTFDRAVEKFDYAFLRKVHGEILAAAKEAAEMPAEENVRVKWDASPILDYGEWPRVTVLADGRRAFTYSKNMEKGKHSFDAVVRFSSDKGKTWSAAQSMIARFERPDGAHSNVTYQICNPHLMQVPMAHAKHPGRLIASANLRAPRGGGNLPSSIGVAVSDDGGKTWTPVKALLPLAGDAGVKGARSCWEPFVQALPTGELRLFYSDIAPVGGKTAMRHVAAFSSKDGGDTWEGPDVVLARDGAWTGIPSAVVCGDDLYLAHEARCGGKAGMPMRPYIAKMRANDPCEAGALICDPLADAFTKSEYAGAPYLVQTKNHFILSAQVAETGKGIDPMKKTQMRVWILPKSRVGANGELCGFEAVENPLGDQSPLLWNGLTATGDDEFLATCQKHGELYIVRGRLVPQSLH